ncbi:MAG: hypothetical protein B6U69_03300 [Thermofilum sp. ex4484_15]|nr:MAG: hypothetical protein B6U69_03300 [Thermofilum sp. ex4484_15]
MKGGLKEYISILKSLKGSKLTIITHPNADPDALASTLGFKVLCEELWGGLGEILLVFPQGISKVSKRVIERLGVKLDYEEEIKEIPDYVAMLDTSNLNEIRIGSELRKAVLKNPNKLIVIDHHHPSENHIISKALISLIIPEAYSTSFLVYSLLREASVKLSPQLASLLLAGILYDTRRFMYSSAEVFRAVADMLSEGVDYPKVVDSLKVQVDLSEKIAKLKGLMRMRVFKVGEWLIATSRIGAFEASLARAMIDAGADVALVASEREGTIRLIARSTKEFFSLTGFSLGKSLPSYLKGYFECDGGGHDTSAGMLCKADIEEVLTKAVEVLANYLKEEVRELLS